jgi:hypothetical protein
MTKRVLKRDEMFWTEEYTLLFAGHALNRALQCKSVIADPLVRRQVSSAANEVWKLYWKHRNRSEEIINIWKSAPALNNLYDRP